MSISGSTVVIGGGTGFVGSHLTRLLQNNGYNVKIISRMPGPQRLSWHDIAKCGLPNDTHAVVNLAGQNVLDMKQKWTPGFKQNVWNSRVNTTQALAQAISKSSNSPAAFVVMTGVGIYEPNEKNNYSETSKTVEFDFLSSLCHEWEKAAQLPIQKIRTRQTTIRSGVVLGRDGGMIKQIYLPFYFGLGGRIASGKQFLPWIHIKDTCNLILFAIENPNCHGILNGVAPQIITNSEFTKAFAKSLRRPACFPIPEMLLNILLTEERAKIMTQGQRVLPERTQCLGFKYEYPNITAACEDIVHS